MQDFNTKEKSKAFIEPVRLGLNDKFNFKCHKDISCFTKCCKGIKINLTPYDIIRLKNRLELKSDEFLAIYTEVNILEKTDLPVVTLKMLDDEDKACPFVKKDGCLVYSDRPSTCRYYPLGVASLSHDKKNQNQDEGFYFFVKEPHCKGFEEAKEWTVKEWREDQGVDIHDEINAKWTELFVRKRSFPPEKKLSEKAKHMFFLGSYNIDKFKDFIFESNFFKFYEIDKKEIEKIKEDEIACLKFALKWLNWTLFQQGDFAIKKEKYEKYKAFGEI